MNCEKCRWSEHHYIPVNSTNLWRADYWFVSYTCLLGGCDGSQYEPMDGESKCVECKGGYCEEECGVSE